MMSRITLRLRGLASEEGGQVLPLMCLMMVVLLGCAGLVVDLGHLGYDHSKLQASTDAAALAGAQALPSTSATTVAATYSSVAGDDNAYPNATVTMVTGYPKLQCLSTLQAMGEACSAPANANSIQVKQQMIVPLYFASIFGFKSYTLVSTATAAMRGSTPTPYNVAIILDATLSQTSLDDNCGTGITEMQCELNGVQALLQTLSPCPTDVATCTINNGVSTNSVDRVALFTFPNVTTSTVGIDSNCTTPIPSNWQYYNASYGGYTMMNSLGTGTPYSGVPTAGPYSNPVAGATSYAGTTLNMLAYPTSLLFSSTVTYQITPFLSDYKTSDKATTLNPNSALVKATGYVSGCGGILPPNYDGDEGTYYAGAIYAAQAALSNVQASYPGSKNVIILLSDGDANVGQWWNGLGTMPGANGSGTYPSYVGDCAQGVAASQYAQAAGTRVYTIAYGSPPTGCSTDVNAGAIPNITPCSAMSQMASAPQDFFSDYLQTGSGSNCMSSAQPETNISAIFSMIAHDLTVARLIPDNTT